MYLPVLNLPNQDLFQRPKPYVKARNLDRWLDKLILNNVDTAIVELTSQIQTLNACYYAANERLKLMLLIQPRAHEIIAELEQTLSTAKLPYKNVDAVTQKNIVTLINEIASAYKLIVSELAILDDSRSNYDTMLSEAIYFSMHYLSLLLLQVYRCYQPEPEDVWNELHQLYHYATSLGLQEFAIDDQLSHADFAPPHTSERMYRRIVLLAISEPYNLMQNESDVVYRLTAKWIDYCNIIPLGDFPATNEYIIDLTDDLGPRYISKDNTWIPTDGLIIDISIVRKKLEADIQRMLRNTLIDSSIEPESLMNRNLRNMMMRLSDNWRLRVSRETIRGLSSNEITLVNSINACHYFLSDQIQFTPAMDEFQMMTESSDQQSTNNSYTKRIKPEEKSQQHIDAYDFALNSDRRHNRSLYLVSTWYEINTSESGVALSGDLEKHTRKIVKVGDLVAYKQKSRKQLVNWQLGIVRWQKSQNRSNIEIGIMAVLNTSVPVAVKGISGIGSGTDYYRSILLQGDKIENQRNKIIVPAFLYDVNSVIVVNANDAIFYIQLTKLSLVTSTIAQFEYKTIDISNVVAVC